MTMWTILIDGLDLDPHQATDLATTLRDQLRAAGHPARTKTIQTAALEHALRPPERVQLKRPPMEQP